jgi:FtsP/CotA-like multicopper oxidase with cupredoxin domain
VTGVPITRRRALAALALASAGVGLAGCGRSVRAAGGPRASSGPVALPAPDRVIRLRAAETVLDLAGTRVRTWAYGGAVPGPPIRVTAGEAVRIDFANDLPVETSVHWHGLAIRNDMDGVPGLTTPATPAGGTFTFGFEVPDPGTHWFHPHHGIQMDHGLYAAFVVDDPAEPGGYDREWVLVLDDWTDGVGPSPEQILSDLRGSGGMGMGPGMGHGSAGIAYPMHLVNGRPSADPEVLRARVGDRVRLRIINAAADTVYVVAVGGHDLRVTHTDGYPVAAPEAGSLVIGMGERYDAVVTLADGVFPLVAAAVGKSGTGRALVRTSSGAVPGPDVRPDELGRAPLTAAGLTAAPGSALPARPPDTEQDLALAGGMGAYVWTINGRTYDQTIPLTVRASQATRLRISNRTMMPHPVHVHGHTFQVGPAGGAGPRKDTLLVPAMGGADVDLVADNPGRWMIHCHNAYHAEAGMMTRLEYTS